MDISMDDDYLLKQADFDFDLDGIDDIDLPVDDVRSLSSEDDDLLNDVPYFKSSQQTRRSTRIQNKIDQGEARREMQIELAEGKPPQDALKKNHQYSLDAIVKATKKDKERQEYFNISLDTQGTDEITMEENVGLLQSGTAAIQIGENATRREALLKTQSFFTSWKDTNSFPVTPLQLAKNDTLHLFLHQHALQRVERGLLLDLFTSISAVRPSTELMEWLYHLVAYKWNPAVVRGAYKCLKYIYKNKTRKYKWKPAIQFIITPLSYYGADLKDALLKEQQQSWSRPKNTKRKRNMDVPIRERARNKDEASKFPLHNLSGVMKVLSLLIQKGEWPSDKLLMLLTTLYKILVDPICDSVKADVGKAINETIKVLYEVANRREMFQALLNVSETNDKAVIVNVIKSMPVSSRSASEIKRAMAFCFIHTLLKRKMPRTLSTKALTECLDNIGVAKDTPHKEIVVLAMIIKLVSHAYYLNVSSIQKKDVDGLRQQLLRINNNVRGQTETIVELKTDLVLLRSNLNIICHTYGRNTKVQTKLYTL